jgi:hypothetical protein
MGPWQGSVDAEKVNDMSHVLLTYSGQVVDLADPDPATIRLEDIANGLTHTICYRGALGVPLTVAQHSVMLSHWAALPKHCRVWALFHNAAEAYLGNVPAPARALHNLAGYSAVERRLFETIVAKYLPSGSRCTGEIRIADDKIRTYEIRRFTTNSVWRAFAESPPPSWQPWWSEDVGAASFDGMLEQERRHRMAWTAEMSRYLWLLRAKQLGVQEVD